MNCDKVDTMSQKQPQGILRRRSSYGGSPARAQSPSGRLSSRVHFAPPENLSELLSTHNFPALEGFITHVRNQQGEVLVAWLQALAENLAILKPKLEPFVLATLDIPWAEKDKPIVAAFTHYLTNLLTAQTFYTKPIMMMLLRQLQGGNRLGEDDDATRERVFSNVHAVIKTALEVSPLNARSALLDYARECMPFMLTMDVASHTAYLRNLMEISFYVRYDEDRQRLTTLVVDRLVQLDAYLPKLEEPEEDDDGEEGEGDQFEMDVDSSRKPVGKLDDAAIAQRNLDEAMAVMFQLLGERFTRDRSCRRTFWKSLLSVFESHILPTHATAHTQFLLFRFLALDAGGESEGKGQLSPYTGAFLDWLWKKFQNPNTPGIWRQATVCYIASLVARGTFVDLGTTKMCLRRIMEWIHKYIAAREERKSTKSGVDPFFCDLKAHGPFYAACQAAFYMFAFRHQEFVAGGRKEMEFLSGLGFQQVVTCSLNPLRVIMPPVVKNFSALVRHLQLAYCDTVIARNSRITLPVVGSLSQSGAGRALLLDSFFPFDPYLLKKSRNYIDNSFRVYTGALIGNEDDEEEESNEEEDDDDDDDSDIESGTEVEMDADGEGIQTKRRHKSGESLMQQFMYGTSPGFKV